MLFIFFFKQKTAYELRISDWSSDVCSSDLSAEVAKRELAHAATHDGLTGLPNRSTATEWLGAELADASDSGDPAVLFIDLDRFKLVNDAHGHAEGDLILIEAGRRLSRQIGRASCRARVWQDV